MSTNSPQKASSSQKNDIDRIRKNKRTRHQSSSSFKGDKSYDLQSLKPLMQEEESKREEALIAKVRQCRKVFDFSDATVDLKNKEIKRNDLADIVDFLLNQSQRYYAVTDKTTKEIVECARINIFRDLKADDESDLFWFDDDDPVYEVSWPHLQLVYEMLLRFIEHQEFDAKVAKKHIDQSFILELLRVLNSVDPREREIIKTILHRIYGRFLGHRAFIRKKIRDVVFLPFIFENQIHRGISELLEILSSIINGFALPLKEEHVDFLKKVLIPLHRHTKLHVYIENLTICIEQYIEKDPELTPDIILGLLRIWPKINSEKERAMIIELQELIERLGQRDFGENEEQKQVIFRKFMVPFTRQIAQCCGSTNFQVADLTLPLFIQHYSFVQFFEANSNELMPIVYPTIYRVTKEHWQPNISKMAQNVLQVLEEMNKTKYDELAKENEEIINSSKPSVVQSNPRSSANDQPNSGNSKKGNLPNKPSNPKGMPTGGKGK